MKGNTKIIDALNTMLAYEMTASDQYFVHAHVYQDMGLLYLYDRIYHEHQEELTHAKVLIERILFLEGTPDLGQRLPANTSRDVPQMLQHDLDTEMAVIRQLREIVVLCEQEQDFVTRDRLMPLLLDTEQDHIHWLEQQLRLIGMVGLQNYLQSQMKPGTAG
ncbi:bacterioferritin [Thauera linaloolentis]|uniref:Bacterioferritin n=1 Tax=Thauera linaloolentis (strain DSM 12138 / JCM 21573 / CCUG 41526 / CIP 105981 / IAM 15112 / NBRC 102519 / 47Lol) TaxID=1123367 RepID=N6ZEA5_THAL4|nr:bacterioferritin [Thauera linaloolentis]ENO90499.1 bacterioferritin [Thauera linaloolentis 47Lol = DSM 12138]MCM8566358.1 bacterioferritin [Thauera linaloolentis]